MLKGIPHEMYSDLCHWVLSSKMKCYLYIKGENYTFMSLRGTENGSHCVGILLPAFLSGKYMNIHRLTRPDDDPAHSLYRRKMEENVLRLQNLQFVFA